MLDEQTTLSLMKDLRLCLLTQNQLHADTNAHRLQRDLIFFYRKNQALSKTDKFSLAYLRIEQASKYWRSGLWHEAIREIDEAITGFEHPKEGQDAEPLP